MALVFLLIGWLLSLLAQPVFDRLAIGLGVGVVRIEFQRTVVSRDCLLILGLLGQRVAEIVRCIATGRLLQRLLCGGIVARAIGRCATPGRIARQLLRLLRAAFAQGLCGLLIGPLPPILPGRRLSCRRQQRQHEQRQQQQPATTKCQRHDQQQRQQQPGATILPFIAHLPVRHGGRRHAQLRVQRVDILMIRRHRHIATTAGGGQRSECSIVTTSQRDAALRITQKAAVGQRHRAALRRAHAKHRHLHAGGVGLACGRVGGRIGVIGDQHQRAAAGLGIVDQRRTTIDRQRGVVAIDRHGVGCQRVKQVVEAARIGGQRRHHERLAGIGDQRIEPVMIAGQQIARLVARAIEPARRHVARQHVLRQRNRHHLRRAACVQRLVDPAPARAG